MPIQSPEYAPSLLPPPPSIAALPAIRPGDRKICVPLLDATQDAFPYISRNEGVKCPALSGTRAAQVDALEELYDEYSSLYEYHNSPESSSSSSVVSSPSPQSPLFLLDTDQHAQPDIVTAQGSIMPKKRRSLQAILVPSFFQSSVSSEGVIVSPPSMSNIRFRSYSAAATTCNFTLPPAIPIAPLTTSRPSHLTPRNSPPSDLLDDDPFADLTPSPSSAFTSESNGCSSRSRAAFDPVTGQALLPQQQPTPRSPLSNSFGDIYEDVNGPWPSPPRTPPSTPVNGGRALPSLKRPRSSGHGQVRPAYTRPAFSSRPSLPSLNTLAQMHVIVPKVRRGRVGATLPVEPWKLGSTSTAHSSEDDEDVSSEARHFSRLSTIRDSSLFAEEPELENHDTEAYDDAAADRAAIARSITPRASEVNRPNAPVLLRAQSDPTSSHSGISMLPDGFISQQLFSDDLCSSPEISFPLTPQSSVEGSGPSHEGHNYFSRFSRQATDSVYDDLAATLDYDYGQAATGLHGSPSLATADSSQADDEDCDFEPGTSARTVRNFMTRQSIHSAHQRTVSAQSATIEWTSGKDGLPISPVTTASFGSGDTSSSATSSDYGDLIDFLSFRDESDEEESEDVTTQASHEEDLSSQYCSSSPAGSNCTLEDCHHNGSSGADVTARLDHLAFTEADANAHPSPEEEQELTDAGEGGRRGERNGSSRAGSDYHQSRDGRENGYISARGGGGSSGGHGQGSGNGRPGKDGNDDWNRRPPARTSVPIRDDSDTSEDEEEEESSDDYGQDRPVPKLNSSGDGQPPYTPSSDDDVPLAQQIPTALRAQRTIRRQVKDEIDQRKRARSVRRPSTTDRSPPISPVYAPIPLPRESVSATVRTAVSSTHEAAPQSASAPVRRPRTKTMPSQPASPFSIGELTKKLLHVQTRTDVLPLPVPQSATSSRRSQDFPLPRTPMSAREAPSDYSARLNGHGDPSGSSLRPPSGDPSSAMGRRLLPMRSFHRPRTATGAHETAPPVPFAGVQLGRSATTATRKHHDTYSSSHTHGTPSRDEGRSSLDRARSTRSHSRRPSAERSSRPSGEHRPPMPSLPSGEVAVVPQITWQQRIFVVNLQRYCQVELNPASTAKDILEILQNQGELHGGAAGWMVWELCQDFGMERPIRSFETITDVTKSWITDKTVNALLVKKTPLAPKLSRAAIPSSSPMCSGFVQWEYKRGKWQKRWLELREHSLWLSKRDTHKDEQMLCSLNNFDAYIVTRVSKAPKAFVFAVKSTDNLSFFESTADYVHVFSCSEPEGQNWLEKILLARSYILHKDHVVLSTNATTSAGAALSRAGTRKQRPAQPLVNFGGPVTSESPTIPPPVFEPGSLLAKRGF